MKTFLLGILDKCVQCIEDLMVATLPLQHNVVHVGSFWLRILDQHALRVVAVGYLGDFISQTGCYVVRGWLFLDTLNVGYFLAV